MPLEATEIRAVFRDVPTSVAVISVDDGHRGDHRVTVGSLCAVSQTPPLLSFCVARDTVAHTRLCQVTQYCISVLAHGQGEVAKRFARRYGGHDLGEHAAYHGLFAAPHALAWLLCTRYRLVEAGDHTIVLARVDAVKRFDRAPLLYWRRDFCGLTRRSPREAELTA